MTELSNPSDRAPDRVLYAQTSEGLTLPILDVTNPAFALSLSEAEQRAKLDEFIHQTNPFDKLPGPLRELAMRLVLRKSQLGRLVRSADGTFLSGMNTYLLKLGASGQYPAHASAIDARVRAALPVLSLLLRVQDVAELLADAIVNTLSTQPARPLCLLNIAGGPAIDSLNALLLSQRRQPALLRERSIAIDVLDLDRGGPQFGRRALEALVASGAPLHGLHATFRDRAYDWSDSSGLQPVLDEARAQNALLLASSEGALFEYGSDAQIVDNLQRLRNGAARDFMIAGSVTRADEAMRVLRQRRTRQSGVRPRGLPVFTELAERAGFRVLRAIERPFSDQVALVPSP